MFLKPIEIPFAFLQYEAFSRRILLPDVRSEAESLYKRGMAGYCGEQSLNYLPEKEFSIFHHLRLFDGHNHFEIDFLLLSMRFFAILEVKNIAGKLTFDTDLLQLIREQERGVDTFGDPLSQAETCATNYPDGCRKTAVRFLFLQRNAW